ncbi:MAG: DUF4347 domain-containing protein, partial [Pseudomonadales bacterium]|nr:DUF4347 domain-containing protein [Pseudomonadales bacterium]
MNNKLIQGLAGVLLPLGLYGAAPQSGYGSYYRPNVRVSAVKLANGSSFQSLVSSNLQTQLKSLTEHEDAVTVSEQLTLMRPGRELLLIDEAVPDKHLLLRGIDPRVEIVVIRSDENGLDQLTAVLADYQNLSALHIVSHATGGEFELGTSLVDFAALENRPEVLLALDQAMQDGADLLLYGCDIAESGDETDLLQLISAQANIDVAASLDDTGPRILGGDWDLEIKIGSVESDSPFSDLATKDFNHLLALSGSPGSGTVDFSVGSDGQYGGLSTDDAVYSSGGFDLEFDGADIGVGFGLGREYLDFGNYAIMAYESSVDFSFQGGESFNLTSIYIYNASAIGNTFDIDGNSAGSDSVYIAGNSGVTQALTGFTGNTSVTVSGTDIAGWLDNLVLSNITGGGGGNDPVINNLNGDSFTHGEDESAEIMDSGGNATVTDADSPANLNGGDLTISVTANAEAGEDLLSFSTAGGFVSLAGTTAGSNVSVDEDGGADGFVVVGTLGNNISEGNDLVVNFNTNATLATTNVLLQRATYENTNENDPVENDRTISFQVTDDTAATSTAAAVAITVAGVNDPATDIGLSNATIAAGSTALGADIGTLSATDVDGGGPTFAIVADGASGSGTCGASGDDDNGSFQINGTTLETSGALTANSYDVCVEIDDGSGTTFQESFSITVSAAANTDPSAISLSPSSIETGDTGANVTVGTLSQTDPDADTWTFDLIALGTGTDGGACSADADNGSFNISGTSLRTTSSLAIGNYEVCVRVSDGTATFKDTLSISVVADTTSTTSGDENNQLPDDFGQRLNDFLNDNNLGGGNNSGGQSCPVNAVETTDGKCACNTG